MGGAMNESDKTPRHSAKKARCAIYTRKSSEEGLGQAFNSLDAQREACAAFILSQKCESSSASAENKSSILRVPASNHFGFA
jgi:site-specific DNA recombinase